MKPVRNIKLHYTTLPSPGQQQILRCNTATIVLTLRTYSINPAPGKEKLGESIDQSVGWCLLRVSGSRRTCNAGRDGLRAARFEGQTPVAHQLCWGFYIDRISIRSTDDVDGTDGEGNRRLASGQFFLFNLMVGSEVFVDLYHVW